MTNPIDYRRYCPFPKHEGEDWETVIEEDRPYVEWLISYEGPSMHPALEVMLTEMLEEEL